MRAARSGWPVFSAPHLPALVITMLITVIGPLFVASYSLAMGDPVPHGVPVGVVGTRAQAEEAARVLDGADNDVLRAIVFDSAADARAALYRQEVYAVIEPDEAVMVVSSASGASAADVLSLRVGRLEAAWGTDVELVDAHPLAPRDPHGLVLFYLALGATILGFVGAIQTRVNAGGMTLSAELGWDAVRSLVVALATTLVIGPVLGLESLPIVPVWLIIAATMFIASTVYSFWRIVIGGRWALLPTWITFVIVANPSSGGAVAPQLLPPFYEFMGRWLPTGATVRAIRDVTYFPGAVHAEPLVLLAVWVIVATSAFVAARVVRYGAGPLPPPVEPEPIPAMKGESK